MVMVNFFFFLDTSALEDDTITFYRKVWKQLLNDAAPYHQEKGYFR
jgi:hypothetical protein